MKSLAIQLAIGGLNGRLDRSVCACYWCRLQTVDRRGPERRGNLVNPSLLRNSMPPAAVDEGLLRDHQGNATEGRVSLFCPSSLR